MDISTNDLNKYAININDVKNTYGKYNYYTYYKYYNIPEFNDKLSKYLENKSSIGVKYSDIIKEIFKITKDLYIMGGTIRDILIDKNINDIDITCDSDKNKVINMCYVNNWMCYINETGKYLKISDNFEGFFDTYREFKRSKVNYDFTANHLIYDLKNKIIIDTTGYGMIDIINRIIRIPVNEKRYNEWASLKWDNCLRFFKLILLGFKPIDNKTTDFIVNYIEDNFDDVYMKITKDGIPRIKEFIIKSITNGIIINKDKYCYGNNLNKVVPYLEILRTYLKINLIKKIYHLLLKYDPYCIKLIGKLNYSSYTINEFKKKYEIFITDKISNMNNSYYNIFNEILKITDNIYIYGGAVRDLLLNITPTDVDIMFDSDVNSVKKLCSINNWPCSKIIEMFHFIIFGKNRGITLEGHYKLTIFNQKVIDYDFTINQMVYDTKNNIVYDMTGEGLKDISNKIIRIPVMPDKYNIWAKKNWKHPLIYFKLKMKGFTPVNKETEDFIVKYIEKNFYNVYMKKDRGGIENIKNYMIKILTHGEIYNNGSYKLGHNKKRLIKYIEILSDSVNPKYMKVIKQLFNVN